MNEPFRKYHIDNRRSNWNWTCPSNLLINNAGIQRDIDLTKGIDEIDEGGNEIQINLEAPILLSSLFIPYLVKKEKAAIINVTVIKGFEADEYEIYYGQTDGAKTATRAELEKKLLNMN